LIAGSLFTPKPGAFHSAYAGDENGTPFAVRREMPEPAIKLVKNDGLLLPPFTIGAMPNTLPHDVVRVVMSTTYEFSCSEPFAAAVSSHGDTASPGRHPVFDTESCAAQGSASAGEMSARNNHFVFMR
jgi:hypothetical protein